MLNESFGANPFPDTGNDPISLADDAAIAAGVTVVASTGDAGTTGTIGSPGHRRRRSSASPRPPRSGRTCRRPTRGAQLSNGTWVNNNISVVVSAVASPRPARVPDLAAPGDLGLGLCTPDPNLYEECTDNNGNPSSIQDFGGTSQSSPLTAGAAALVIQAYENTHHGVRPAPALVKQLLTSTATDLGHPAYEQGAGLLNSLAAVQAAASWADATATGEDQGPRWSSTRPSCRLQGYPGSTAVQTLAVRNVSTKPQKVWATTRTLGHRSSAAYGRSR